jgi:cytochrome c peroxidase
MGKFRTQSLRNVAVTAPYFHDGSAATLDEVITHYASAGRSLEGPQAGMGHANPYKDPLIVGFSLDGTVLEDLKAFLHSLTDNDFLTDLRFSNPWPDNHPARGNQSVTTSPENSTENTQP